jgi:hypothetical protein
VVAQELIQYDFSSAVTGDLDFSKLSSEFENLNLSGSADNIILQLVEMNQKYKWFSMEMTLSH